MRYALIAGFLLLSTISLLPTDAKVFTHCELAQELRRLQIPESQIATWVCIAHYESRLNSSAISGTGDHGIFQISEEYWCSPPGRGKGCGLSCAELEDDNISDDVECVQTIFEEHQGLSGNGFTAWAVYPRCKKSSSANRFIKKCASAGSGGIDNSIDSSLDLRFSTAQRESFSKPSYNPIQDFSHNPIQDFSQDYSFPSSKYFQFQSSSRPSQEFSFSRTSASPFQQGYDYSGRSFSYTPRRPFQIISSSTLPPSQAILSSVPSIYSSSRPSSYSIGSIYYNPFETRSTTSAPVVYTFSPKKSFSSSLFAFQSTSAPQVYKSYSRSDDAAIKTSSPAPPLKIKAPWADFPWWNGGK